MIVQSNGRIYAIVFYFFWFLPPVMFAFECAANPTLSHFLIELALILATLGTLILNTWRCSSRVLSYWQGVCFVSAHWMTGCVNISVFIILPIIFWIHLHSCVLSLISLLAGRTWAQRGFLGLCYALSRRGFNLAEANASLEKIRSSGR